METKEAFGLPDGPAHIFLFGGLLLVLIEILEIPGLSFRNYLFFKDKSSRQPLKPFII